jgi:antitoxin ParD1/3/4
VSMDDIRISLSDSTKALVDEELAAGHYASVAECVGALLDAGAKAKAQEKLEALLLEGLEGEDIEWTDADWDKLRNRIAAR